MKIKVKVERYVTADGKIPLPPSPAYAVTINGRPALNLTTDELDHIVYGHYAPVLPEILSSLGIPKGLVPK